MGQGEQASLMLYLSAGHAKALGAVQVLDPANEKRPSAQSVQELAPADEYEFAKQGSQPVEPACLVLAAWARCARCWIVEVNQQKA